MSNMRDTARDYSEAVSAGGCVSSPLATPARASHPLAGEGSSAAGVSLDVSSPTAPPVSDGRRRLLDREGRAELAQRIQALMDAERLTMAEAGKRLNVSPDMLQRLARDHSLRADPAVIRERRIANLRSGFVGPASLESLNRGRAIQRERSAAEDARIVAALQVKSKAEVMAEFGVTVRRLRLARERHAAANGEKRTRAAINAATALEWKERRARVANDLRRVVNEGYSITKAGELLGMRRDRALKIAREFGVKPQPKVRPVRLYQPKAPRAVTQTPEPMAERRVRNPMLTPAQQAQVDRHKAAHWRPAALKGLPPVTRDEADALVREWLARNKPTVCAPAVVVEPSNAGARWK
jgi:transcriptional regulator with XRE-family HTH domain